MKVKAPIGMGQEGWDLLVGEWKVSMIGIRCGN